MSPTENDLRAALRDGEGDGDGLDVDRIVNRGRAARARRRSQLLNAAAAVILVGGLGTGTALLLGGNGSDGSGGGSAASSARGPFNADKAAPAGGAASDAGGAPAPVPSARVSAAAAVTCPDSLPRYLLPPTGAGAAEPLFSAPVATAVVCAYGSETAPRTPATRVELTGADAKVLVDSLEQSSTTKPGGMCPNYRRADEQSLAVIGIGADGSRVGLVTTTLGRPACAVDVRNGKVVRYAWQPPAAIEKKLGRAVPVGGMSHGPVVQSSRPGKVQSVAPAN